MKKNFTLMKTLTAFSHLLFPASRKNSRAVNNDQIPGKGCCTSTTVEDQSKDMNDAKQTDASFLFFNQADSQQSMVDGPQSIDNDQHLKSKEDPDNYPGRKINDELALGSSPKPVYKNWRERVNDDLAACVTVDREATVVSRESVTVIDDPVKNSFPTTINDETRTNKNDAWLPFASFSLLLKTLLKINPAPTKTFQPVYVRIKK